MEASIRLPTFQQIPFKAVFAIGVGYICGKITETSTELWIRVSVITTLADNLLFLMASQGIHSMQSKIFTYAFTNAFVCTIQIIALKQLNLLGIKGTLILTGLTAWTFIVRTALAVSR